MFSVSNYFLVASIKLSNSFFHKKVVYIFDHGKGGAIGIVINQSLHSLKVQDIGQYFDLDVSKIQKSTLRKNLEIFQGGPIHSEKGFILHADKSPWKATMSVYGGLSLTSSEDMLKSVFQGQVWNNHIFILGYTAWSPNQLDQELSEGLWHIVPFFYQLVFDISVEQRWEAALNSIQIDSNSLVNNIGHA